MAPKSTKNKAAEEVAVTAEVITEVITEAEVVPEIAENPGVPEALTPEKEAKSHFRYMRELIPVTPAPPRTGEDPNYHIGINGKNWLLPRGKTSMVPRYVADAFNQAEAAKGVQIDNQAKLLENHSGGAIDLSNLSEQQIAQLKTLLGLG